MAIETVARADTANALQDALLPESSCIRATFWAVTTGVGVLSVFSWGVIGVTLVSSVGVGAGSGAGVDSAGFGAGAGAATGLGADGAAANT